MDVLLERCSGLDVHRDTVVATVRLPEGRDTSARRVVTRTFGTDVPDLMRLGDWLGEHRVQLVGMESTGVYWKPVFFVLEDRFTVWLLNAEHLHNVPGRKTDVADSVWITELLEHGLVAPSFVPPPPIRELRDYTRYRRRLVEERTRAVQRLEKILQDAGIKLTSVASQLLTKSGRAILEALVAGQTSPTELAELAKGRLRSKIPQLRDALTSRFVVAHHGELVARMLGHIDYLDEQITGIEVHIEGMIGPFEAVLARLVTIPGVNRLSAIGMVAEIGVDMGVFPTAGHLASWAGICPGNHASGGKRHSGRTRHGSVWLRTILTEVAHAAARTKGTYLAAHYQQIRGRRGPSKAIGAIRHDVLIAYWHIVTHDVDYRDLGPDWARRPQARQQQTRRLTRQLEQLGHKVTLEPAA